MVIEVRRISAQGWNSSGPQDMVLPWGGEAAAEEELPLPLSKQGCAPACRQKHIQGFQDVCVCELP